MPAVLVVEWKFGQADNEVPISLPSMTLQPTHRGLDVLSAGGEWLTHNRDFPSVAAVDRAQVGHTSRDLGRRGWISHQPDANGLHMRSLPALGGRDTPSKRRTA
jgi:hypothetical protein